MTLTAPHRRHNSGMQMPNAKHVGHIQYLWRTYASLCGTVMVPATPAITQPILKQAPLAGSPLLQTNLSLDKHIGTFNREALGF